MKRLAELSAAFALLTRLPLGGLAGQADFARAVWAYPLVGGVIGLFGGTVYWMAAGLGLSPPLSAFWTLAAMTVFTGALHEDGLADTTDGFGGGRTAERRLEIMRDSRIGSYGALALIFSILLRGIALATLAEPHLVVPALVASGSLGRLAILVVLWRAKPARKDGLAASLSDIPPASILAGGVIACLAALTQPWMIAAFAVAATVQTGVSAARLAQSQIGGHTGDVLGAASLVTECVVLSLLTLG